MPFGMNSVASTTARVVYKKISGCLRIPCASRWERRSLMQQCVLISVIGNSSTPGRTICSGRSKRAHERILHGFLTASFQPPARRIMPLQGCGGNERPMEIHWSFPCAIGEIWKGHGRFTVAWLIRYLEAHRMVQSNRCR